jgi:hypothetical protein
MPYNLPTNNKIDVKLINLRLKEYVEERARIKDESAKKLSKAFVVVSDDLVNLQNQSNIQAAAINDLSMSVNYIVFPSIILHLSQKLPISICPMLGKLEVDNSPVNIFLSYV